MSLAVTAVVASVASAGIGAYTNYRSSREQIEASERATNAQLAAQETNANALLQSNRENIAFQKEVFEQQKKDIEPWLKTGLKALAQLQLGMESGSYKPGSFLFQFDDSVFSEEYDNSDAYNFIKQEGINALDASAASRGMLQSGAQSKALTKYSNDLAATYFDQEYNRRVAARQNTFQEYVTKYNAENAAKQTNFNQLASLAQTGQVANTEVANARNSMANVVGQGTLNQGNIIGQNALNQGNITANNYLNQGNIRASSYQNYANLFDQGASNLLTQTMWNDWLKTQGKTQGKKDV